MRKRLRRGIAAIALLGSAAVAQAQQARTVLPIPPAPFNGTMADTSVDARPAPLPTVRAPAGAPNVLLFMSDDVGFAMSSAFGGPVPTPNFDRLAAMGQRYNRFHTTGICSPSRAALLTGRNHHNAGVGYLSDLPMGFPGYNGRISPETATIAQVLRLNGYNTAMFGKHHNVPSNERSEAGPFDAWPTGIGFEYFFGFPQGDSDQYSPDLYRDTARVDPDEDAGMMLDQRLAKDLIRWVHNQKAGAPDKPFFAYLAPGSTHAPHQAPPEYIARFKGKFDQGWDKVREESFQRQLAAGIIPKGTILTPRPAGIPAWESLTSGQKAFAARTMEVAAGQMAFEDVQFGRILAELDRMGELQKTLVIAIEGDNGASGEAGPRGTINELRGMGSDDENEAWMERNIAQAGGPMTYENYPVGWAWAMNTPLRWTKQFASMLGGIRNGMILSWPGHVAHPGSICDQFSHLIDVAPTVLGAATLPAPQMVLGAPQKPMDGQSLLPSLTACNTDLPRSQYFEMGGKIGFYRDGWFLSGEDGRQSWEGLPPGGPNPKIEWTLYDLNKDFSQSTDLSAQEPKRLQEMIALWRVEAERNNVFPLTHASGRGRAGAATAALAAATAKHIDFWGKDVSIPAIGRGSMVGRSFTLRADLTLDKAAASGVVVALGSHFGGWSLYLDQGHPSFVFAKSTDPNEIFRVRADAALPRGATRLEMRFATAGPGQPADVVLSAGGKELARVRLATNMLSPAGGGETLDVGRDLGVAVTDYRTPHGAIEGDISHVTVDFD